VSGGAWGYLQYHLEEEGRRHAAIVAVLAQIEHELDWGASGDTCHDCARVRVCAALEEFFEKGCNEADAALAILESGYKVPAYMCEADQARFASATR
jgi:hypothetical protein